MFKIGGISASRAGLRIPGLPPCLMLKEVKVRKWKWSGAVLRSCNWAAQISSREGYDIIEHVRPASCRRQKPLSGAPHVSSHQVSVLAHRLDRR